MQVDVGDEGPRDDGFQMTLNRFSRVVDMREILKELGWPFYGDQATLWERLVKAERHRFERQRLLEYEAQR